MKRILFLATEDWFVRSHFLGLLQRAQAEGFDVIVAARASGALAEDGVRVIDTPFARGSLKPWEVGRQIKHLRQLLERERPDIIHAFGLKPIAILILSQYRDAARLFAITGRGYFALARAPWARLVSAALQIMVRRALQKPRTALVVENRADQVWAGADEAFLMPGAGVDPDAFSPSPEPSSPPIIVGIVSRLVASKGIDIAVAAIAHLRAQGLPIVLRIAGGADPENPEHVSDAELARWRATDGVELLGPVSDVNAFWASTHIACLPSRGGEGLPRSLLEAAACGRVIVTTDTPGCADFVLHQETGLVVAPDDAHALAQALALLVNDERARQRMGEAGRARVIAGYTLRHAADCAASAWAQVMRA